MININSAILNSMSVHFVGNKSTMDKIILSKNGIEIDDETSALLTNYFLHKFENVFDQFKFHHSTSLQYNEMYNYVNQIFNNEGDCHEISVNIANQLYESSVHPKIKPGELFVCRFSNCELDGKYLDAIGIFKTENKASFFEVKNVKQSFDIQYKEGIDVNKFDKGCLIFNKNEDNGYDIRIMRGGNLKVTSVSDVNKDDTELLELAVKKRDELLKQVEENGEFDKHQKKLDHNNNPLPKCVACIVARGNPGYQITYEKAGKLIRKSFTDKSKTMDDKLDSAKKYLEELQNDFQGNVNAKEAEKQNDRLDHNKNPLPDRIFKFHQRGIDGYRCIIKKDGKDVKYVCCGKTTSLDDKLASCVKWLEENNL